MMTDDFARARSEKLIALYTRYRARLDTTTTGGRWMAYRWWTLPDRLDAAWMAYSQMLNEYASELANIINDLTHHVDRLRAWDEVVATLDDGDKLDVSQPKCPAPEVGELPVEHPAAGAPLPNGSLPVEQG